MLKVESKSRLMAALRQLLLTFLGVAGVSGLAAGAEPATRDATFAKDVAPILQAKCQMCHRPGSIAPMSLLTYEEARPWARSIKQRVIGREMPPWGLDKHVGIQKFKNDRSLSDEEIDVISRWVDGGAVLGNLKDLPPPIKWPDSDAWMIGKPDLTVSFPADHVVPVAGPDWWGDIVADTGLTEDRWIKAVETKPSEAGRRVVHHAATSIEGDDAPNILGPDGQALRIGGGGGPGAQRVQGAALAGRNTFLSEYAAGKTGDIYADNTGLLLPAGSKVSFNMHYHSIGEEIRDRTTLAFIFYPKGVVPKYHVIDRGPSGGQDLDIPPNSMVRHDAYLTLTKPTKIISFQPHMHTRGHAQTLEAILPTGGVQVLSAVDHYDFNWQIAYVYDEDVAPLLPAGTVLHSISVHDNTPGHKGNPDPSMWVGWGNRTIDEMANIHLLRVELEEADYKALVAERRAKQKTQEAAVQAFGVDDQR